MVSRGGGFSFLDDRVTRLWYVRRAVTVAVLLAIVLGMAGYAVYGYCQRREQEYVYFIRSMSSYYREDMGEGRGGMYGEVVKPVSDDFVKNRDAGAWLGDPVKPGKEGELRHVMDIYNGLYPEKKTNVGEFRRYYGSIERSFHKAGSAVKDPPSNYSYYTGVDGRYDYFELRSVFEAGR